MKKDKTISKCFHGVSLHCKPYRNRDSKECSIKENCTLKPILVDAQLILAHQGISEEESPQLIRKLIRENRNRHIITVTSLILGEITKTILRFLYEGERDRILGETLNNFLETLTEFEIQEIPINESLFQKMLKKFLKNEELTENNTTKIGTYDIIHISVAVFYNIPFYTSDLNIHKNKWLIESLISEINSEEESKLKLTLPKL